MRGCLGDGYTPGMKTAVSLPDQVFQAAERHAKRAHKSRSQLYAEALAEYLTRHSPDEVTEAMNRVLEDLGGDSAPMPSLRARDAGSWSGLIGRNRSGRGLVG